MQAFHTVPNPNALASLCTLKIAYGKYKISLTQKIQDIREKTKNVCEHKRNLKPTPVTLYRWGQNRLFAEATLLAHILCSANDIPNV